MTEVSRDAQPGSKPPPTPAGGRSRSCTSPRPAPCTWSGRRPLSLQRSPGVRPRSPGERLAASYVNFYPATSRIVFPLLDERHDEQAAEVLGACFPEREVVGVPSREILLGGGNIHCITQQVPSAPSPGPGVSAASGSA